MSLTRKLTRPLTRPVAIASGATAESDNVVLSGGYKSFTPTFVGDKSIKFDGTDDYVDTGFQPDFIHTGATMSSWVKMGDFSGMQFMGTHYSKRFYYGFNGTTAVMGVQNAHNVDTGADLSSFIAVGQWHHIVMVADNGTATFYLDGVARDTLSYTPSAASNPSDGLYIGARGHGSVGQFMNASIDEVAIFSSALTAREVDALYNNGQPTNLSSYSTLEAWYRMGEGKLDAKRDGDENLLFDQGPNGGLGSELMKADGDLYQAGPFFVNDTNIESYPNGTAARFERPSSGGSENGGFFRLRTTGSESGATQDLVTGRSYELSFDFLTDDSDSSPRLYQPTTGYYNFPAGSGRKSYCFTAQNATSQFVNAHSLDNGKFVQFSGITLKEIVNSGVINGARIQADGGEELVTNGGFDTNSNWTTGSGFTISSGKATRVIGQNSDLSQTLSAPLVNGAQYKISFNAEDTSGNTTFAVRLKTPGEVESSFETRGADNEIFLTASNAHTVIDIRPGGSGTGGAIDNISLKEITESVPKQVQNLRPIAAPQERSLSFDGTDDSASVPFELPTGTWTVSQWINVTDTGATDTQLYVWESRDASHTSGNIMHPIKASASTYKNRWWNAGAFRISPTTQHPIGLWQHVVFVKDAGTGTMYVDGEAVGTATGFSTTADNAPNMLMGARYSNELHTGVEIDELAIWDTALDGDAVKAIYNAGQPTHLAAGRIGAYDIYRDNLKAYYRMGDATNPAADGTSNLLFDQTNPGLGSTQGTNLDFETGDLTGWTVSNSNAQTCEVTKNSAGSNALHIVSDGAFVSCNQRVTTVVGSVYKLEYDLELVSGNAVENTVGPAVVRTSSGTYTRFITATSTSTPFEFKRTGSCEFFVDNVSVKEINGNTASITGATIQTEAPKQIYALPPVANTKSLNFSTDDYLQTQVDDTAQPNNESRYYSFWAKSSQTTVQTVFSHGGWHIGGFLFNSANSPLLYMASNVYQYWADNGAQDDGNWHHWVVKIKYNDLTGCELWCDGEKLTKTSNVNSGSMNTYSTGIQIGAASQSNSYFNGSLDEFSIHEDLDEEAIRALFNRGRPIDISSGNGAYDLSDKALHWWRMGDATNDGTNDIIFEGFSEEGNEEVTNGDFSNGTTGWTISNTGGQTVEVAANSAGSNALHIVTDGTLVTATQTLTTVAGRVYRLQYDLELVSGEMKDSFEAAVTRSESGTYTRYFTATDSSTFVQFKRSTASEFFVDNVSVKQVRGQYIGPELVKADADLYQASNWTAFGNTTTFPNGTAARFLRPTSGGNSVGARTKLSGVSGAALTANLETGCVYKLQFDFLTDDDDAYPRYYDGSSYTDLSSGSGLKVHYFAYSGSTGTRIQTGALSAEKFVQFSGLSVKKVGGAAVMTNMTTSDLQLDTPY